jgi:type II secretory pathway pseudopilin PulG
VWVETVVYLLIAFAMIGLVLAFIKPKIEEMRDKAIIEQSLEMMKEIDNSITTIGSSGNRRLLEVGIKKGSLTIDSENDVIIFEIQSSYAYTEPGEPVQVGEIQALTEETGRGNTVTLKRDFSEEYDLTYVNQEVTKSLTKAPNAYRLFITNKGESSNKVLIDFSIE